VRHEQRVDLARFQQAPDLFPRRDDPNWSRLAWGRHFFEEERNLLGEDPWPYGVGKNRANIERFMGYSLDQGLMEKKPAVEDIFAPATLDT